jgi:hypothetical protein
VRGCGGRMVGGDLFEIELPTIVLVYLLPTDGALSAQGKGRDSPKGQRRARGKSAQAKQGELTAKKALMSTPFSV